MIHLLLEQMIKSEFKHFIISGDIEFISCDVNRVLSLVGLGVRLKSIGPIQAKVYSVGLYLDQAAAKTKLHPFKSIAISKLVASKDFEDAVRGGWLHYMISVVLLVITFECLAYYS